MEMEEEKKPEIPLFGEHLWLKEEVRYDPGRNILSGYDGCYYIEVDFDRGVIRGRRLGVLEVYEDGMIQFRDGENYKDAVEDVGNAKVWYGIIGSEMERETNKQMWRDWENASTLEELAEVIRKYGFQDGDRYYIIAYEHEPDIVFLQELDDDAFTELYRLAGKDALEKDNEQKQDVKSKKRKYNRGMGL
ncbi:hypothetical protein [Hydrogenivirga sp. 128-5-R1-1]|uniref:hypothetical protein n=1 Tax=Hydrogenivirga sp. 128-5-R1-1 TaxID=392423 RepID=UPI00015EF046|nr:hypothetical protein [Hydrogenivirga sp. 128-5-R1-1]EDP74674.1 hypothetical protein HG1285_14719 [Hydrogenivirga sp. 128-5-R1-1]